MWLKEGKGFLWWRARVVNAQCYESTGFNSAGSNRALCITIHQKPAANIQLNCCPHSRRPANGCSDEKKPEDTSLRLQTRIS